MEITSRSLRRAIERQERKQAKRPPRPHGRNRNPLLALDRSTPFDEEEFASFSNEVRMAWHRICTGDGATQDFDNLAHAFGTSTVLSEPLGGAAIEAMQDANAAMRRIRERYLRTGKFGPDADALRSIPVALDLHDEFLRNCTPWQMTRALEEALRRFAEMAVTLEQRKEPQ